MKLRIAIVAALSAFALLTTAIATAQGGAALGSLKQEPVEKPATDQPSRQAAAGQRDLPGGYVIGAEDVLTVVVWNEKELSRDVIVRPDGKISLPLINDISAAGLTPEQLRDKLVIEAQRFVEGPTVTVIVTQINSQKVFLIGEVIKPGSYPLNAPTTVLQLIATAGGLQEYAKSKEIVVVRTESGRTTILPFNYRDVMKQKNLHQNITLKPGDTVVVP